MIRLSVWLSVCVVVQQAAFGQTAKGDARLEEVRLLGEELKAKRQVLSDRSVADLVTDDDVYEQLVIEVAWSKDWAKAVGDIVHKATLLKKRLPAIVLLRHAKDDKDVERCTVVCRRLAIHLMLRDTTAHKTTKQHTPSLDQLVLIDALRRAVEKDR